MLQQHILGQFWGAESKYDIGQAEKNFLHPFIGIFDMGVNAYIDLVGILMNFGTSKVIGTTESSALDNVRVAYPPILFLKCKNHQWCLDP